MTGRVEQSCCQQLLLAHTKLSFKPRSYEMLRSLLHAIPSRLLRPAVGYQVGPKGVARRYILELGTQCSQLRCGPIELRLACP